MKTEWWILVTILALGGFCFQSWRLKMASAKLVRKRNQWNSHLRKKLKQFEQNRDQLFDALGDAFILVDEQSKVIFANSAAIHLFGNRRLIGRPANEAFLDDQVLDVLQHCLQKQEALQKQIVHSNDYLPNSNDNIHGQTTWIVDVAPVPVALEDTRDVRMIIRDVTAQQQINQVRKDFVANASHELRTPLAIINGYLENLIDNELIEEPEMAMRFLKLMRKHSNRISRIVEDMLMISKLESGEASSLKIDLFHLLTCMIDVKDRLESVIENQGATVELKLHDENLQLYGDQFYMTQILFNLVENALKQNPDPGLRVEIGSLRIGDEIEIWVKDSGVGIPSLDLPHIFRRFYRVAKHHSQQEIKGTGLGLSIVKRAVEAHGAKISVTSTPGIETCFRISFPANLWKP